MQVACIGQVKGKRCRVISHSHSKCTRVAQQELRQEDTVPRKQSAAQPLGTKMSRCRLRNASDGLSCQISISSAAAISSVLFSGYSDELEFMIPPVELHLRQQEPRTRSLRA